MLFYLDYLLIKINQHNQELNHIKLLINEYNDEIEENLINILF